MSFCVGVGQQLVLLLLVAPLLALYSPPLQPRGMAIWTSAAAFMLTFWFWHMPCTYDAAINSVWIYCCMQATVLLTSIYLWRELWHHPSERWIDALAAGALTFVHMALLGALLVLADRPLFTFQATDLIWNITALDDQRIGGMLIGAPALLLLGCIVLRVALRLCANVQPKRRQAVPVPPARASIPTLP
jgi:putative membrane protein